MTQEKYTLTHKGRGMMAVLWVILGWDAAGSGLAMGTVEPEQAAEIESRSQISFDELKGPEWYVWEPGHDYLKWNETTKEYERKYGLWWLETGDALSAMDLLYTYLNGGPATLEEINNDPNIIDQFGGSPGVSREAMNFAIVRGFVETEHVP